jgi:hypothetical protein
MQVTHSPNQKAEHIVDAVHGLLGIVSEGLKDCTERRLCVVQVVHIGSGA